MAYRFDPFTGNFSASPTSADGVQFTQSGTGAAQRTVESKLQDVVSLKDFGAVGDGVTDDKAAVKAALESGMVVDGGGFTYAINGTCQPTSCKGLQNAKLKQIASDNSTQNYSVLFLEGLSDFVIRDVLIHMGDDVDTLFADDGRNGLKIWGTLSGTGTTQTANYITDFVVDNVTVTGSGCGAGIHVRHAKRFKIINSSVRDRVAGSSPDPTNDSQNGFSLFDCEGFTVDSCIASNLKTRLGDPGVDTNKWTRGFLFAEIRDCNITGCSSNSNDQGYDFSGTVFDTSPTYYEGNRSFNVSGCEANNNGTFGFKFANTTHDGLISGCIATNIGGVGFVVSSKNETSGALTTDSYRTQNLTFTGCKVVNITGTNGHGHSLHGFLVDEQSDGPAAYPRNVKFVGCDVTHKLSLSAQVKGFSTNVTPIVVPNAGYNTPMTVSAVDCTASGTDHPFVGMHHAVCRLTGSSAGSTSDSTWTDVPFSGSSKYDPSSLHSNSLNAENVYIKESGNYHVKATVVWNDGSTGAGDRRLRFVVNGNPVGGEGLMFPTGSSQTVVTHSEPITLDTGSNIRVQVYQNSGGTINIDRDKSTFSVSRMS